MYGTDNDKVRCFAASKNGEIEELSVDARTLDECSLQVCSSEGAYTIIPVYKGGKIASRWNEHLTRFDTGCELLSIPNSKVFTSSDNHSEPLIQWYSFISLL